MIAANTWREIRLISLLYVLLLESLLVIAIVEWPPLRDKTETLAPLQQLLPADFMKRWVADVMSRDVDVAYGAYVAIQIVGLACACLFGTALIARERENRTLELLLSRPVSRSRILLAKFAVCSAAIVVPIFATSWSAIPLSWAIDENLAFWPVTLGAAYASAYCLVFLALTGAFSVRLRTQIGVAFVVGAVVIFQVGLYFVPQVRAYSVFRLSDYDVYSPILAGNVSASSLLFGNGGALLLALAVTYCIADRLFQRAEL
jgi:ABC-2 type transport system permease protein